MIGNKAMTNQPTKCLLENARLVMTFDCLVRVDHNLDRADFSGPNREANAKLFIAAQHMAELVELSERVCDQLDGHTKLLGYVLPEATRLRAILAKIKGAAK